MKLSVDQGKCQGNALCAAIASEVFALDDDEKAYVKVDLVPGDVEPKVRSAVSSCPEQAIAIAN